MLIDINANNIFIKFRLENMYIQLFGLKIGRIFLISNFFLSQKKLRPESSYDSRKHLISKNGSHYYK